MTITVVNKYKEPNHIYCGRGSPVGNPFTMSNESQRDKVCDKYHAWFHRSIKRGNPSLLNYLDMIIALAEKGDINLGCYCAPKRCHCETIKEYVESQLSTSRTGL